MGSQHVTRIRFKESRQRELIEAVMKKLDLSQRGLSNKLGISRRALRNWIYETRLLPDSVFYEFVDVLPETYKFSNFIIEKLPDKWGKVKGGIARSKMKNNLTKKLRVKGFRAANKNSLKRKVKGPFKELMYNIGEKKIAEILVKNKIKYKYEPFLNLDKRYAFPDFIAKNSIIERCGYSNWSVYWNRLLEKVLLYEKYHKGNIILVTPNNRFDIAVKKIGLKVKNVIILKENDIGILPSFIMGP